MTGNSTVNATVEKSGGCGGRLASHGKVSCSSCLRSKGNAASRVFLVNASSLLTRIWMAGGEIRVYVEVVIIGDELGAM